MSIPVFCYHDTSPLGLPPELFARHLDAIRDAGYTTITGRELHAVCTGTAKPRRKTCVLTFDDGHVSNWLEAAPLLAERGMTGVFFVLADFIGAGPARRAGDVRYERMSDSLYAALRHGDTGQFMNEAELRALVDMGMDVQSHGCRHQGCFRNLTPNHTCGARKAHWCRSGIYAEERPHWPLFQNGSAYVYDGFWPIPRDQDAGDGAPNFRLRPTEERRAFCARDFARSLERVRAINGDGPQLFCWPWGHFDELSLAELKKAGYDGAFTLERGPVGPGTDPFRLNRVGVTPKKDEAWIRSRLRMYSSPLLSRLAPKRFRKAPEIRSVLYATDTATLSGGSRQLVNNAIGMRGLGLDVEVALSPGSGLAVPLREAGVPVREFPDFKSPRRTATFLRERVRGGVDAVHAFHNKAYKGGVLAKLCGPRFRLFINRGVIYKPNALMGLWARIADGMIANSFAASEALTKFAVPASRVSVIHNAFVPPRPMRPRALRKKRGVRIAYLGNSAPVKGFDVFLRMARILCDAGLRDAEFVALGVDHPERFADLLAGELKNRIALPGKIPHHEVLDELEMADILVSSSRMESFPNGLLEAFFAGAAVVATAVGGVPELIHEGENGFLCPSEDAECLAAKVRPLLDDYPERVRLGALCQRLVATRFSNEIKTRTLYRVYSGETVREPLIIEIPQADQPGPDPDEVFERL